MEMPHPTNKSYSEAIAEVERLVDGLGTHIDPRIRELVTALRMHNVDTVGSCEGHTDHGYPYPWIDIGTSERLPKDEPPVEQPLQDLAARLQQAAIEFGNVKINSTVIKDKDWYFVEATPQGIYTRKHAPRTLSPQAKARGLEQIKLVNTLLDAFYRAHPSPYSDMIGIEPLGSPGNVRIRLQCNIAAAIPLMENAQKVEHLTQAQAHMSRLAKFLLSEAQK
jgi:hypothetical protein